MSGQRLGRPQARRRTSARCLGIIEEARAAPLIDYADALSKRPRANPSGFLRAVAGNVVSLTLYRRQPEPPAAGAERVFRADLGSRRPWLRALSEALTAAVLLPTAAVGSVVRLYRSVGRRDRAGPPGGVWVSRVVALTPRGGRITENPDRNSSHKKLDSSNRPAGRGPVTQLVLPGLSMPMA